MIKVLVKSRILGDSVSQIIQLPMKDSDLESRLSQLGGSSMIRIEHIEPTEICIGAKVIINELNKIDDIKTINYVLDAIKHTNEKNFIAMLYYINVKNYSLVDAVEKNKYYGFVQYKEMDLVGLANWYMEDVKKYDALTKSFIDIRNVINYLMTAEEWVEINYNGKIYCVREEKCNY